jgi:hypothetical protein
VARWVKAFKEGRQNVADVRRLRLSEEVYALSALLETDRRRTIRELLVIAAKTTNKEINSISKELLKNSK